MPIRGSTYLQVRQPSFDRLALVMGYKFPVTVTQRRKILSVLLRLKSLGEEDLC